MPDPTTAKVDAVLRAFVREARSVTRGDEQFEHGPSILEYAFTSACNLRCPMCSQAENPPVIRAPKAEAVTFLGSVLPSVTVWVPSATSEPLLNDVDTMIAMCREHRVFIDLITNVTLLTPEVLDRLVPHLYRLTLSLDSSVPHVFEAVRWPAKWAKALPNITYALQRAVAEQIACVVHSVFMAETAPHLPELIDFVADHGGFEVTVLEQLYNTSDAAEHSVARLGAERVEEILRTSRERAHRRGVNLTLRIAGPHGGRWKVREEGLRITEALVVDSLQDKLALEAAGYCPQVGHYLKVEPDGEAFPCCRGPRELRLGNVYREGFDAVWNGAPARSLRRAMATGEVPSPCRDCLVRQEPLRDRARNA